MTTALVTPAAMQVRIAENDLMEVIPTTEALAAAVAAVSVAGEADSTARATLAEVVRARYVFRMTKHVRTVDGVTVLPDNKRKEVAALIWLDATGNVTPVPVKERTPGEVSLAQYVARYGTVAADLVLGTQALCDVETASATYKAINAAKHDAKANAEAAEEALAQLAQRDRFKEWLSTQPQRIQTAFRDVAHTLKGDGAPHVAAFFDSVTLVSK